MQLSLIFRAYKYRYRNDRGEIAYVIDAIQPGQTVFDIGAHKAGYLYWMRKRAGNTGKVIAFEPQSRLYQYLVRVKKGLGWRNVVIEPLALSDAESDVPLYMPSDSRKGSSPGATIVDQQDKDSFQPTETVHTQTLDDYCLRYRLQPAFLKIDVEGNEGKVFRGAVKTLTQYKPKILVEIESRHVGREKVRDTFHFLQKLQYKGFIIQGLNRLPLEKFDFDIHQNGNDKKNYCNNFIFE